MLTKDKITRIYHQVREKNFVWRYILNFFPTIRFLLHRKNLRVSEIEERILDEMRLCGVATVHVDDFLGVGVLPSLLGSQHMQGINDRLQSRRENRERLFKERKLKELDYFLVDLWEGPHEIDLSDSFVRLCLREEVLRVVNLYMGMYAKLRFWELKGAIDTPYQKGKLQSQNWHTDRGDKIGVKVFLYLNDVTKNNGPFSYLRYSHHGSRWDNISKRTTPFGVAIPAQKIFSEDVKICTGKRGTLIFADTSGVHSGGHFTNEYEHRVMFTASFTSQASLWPVLYTVPKNLSTKNLTLAARSAIQL